MATIFSRASRSLSFITGGVCFFWFFVVIIIFVSTPQGHIEVPTIKGLNPQARQNWQTLLSSIIYEIQMTNRLLCQMGSDTKLYKDFGFTLSTEDVNKRFALEQYYQTIIYQIGQEIQRRLTTGESVDRFPELLKKKIYELDTCNIETLKSVLLTKNPGAQINPISNNPDILAELFQKRPALQIITDIRRSGFNNINISLLNELYRRAQLLYKAVDVLTSILDMYERNRMIYTNPALKVLYQTQQNDFQQCYQQLSAVNFTSSANPCIARHAYQRWNFVSNVFTNSSSPASYQTTNVANEFKKISKAMSSSNTYTRNIIPAPANSGQQPYPRLKKQPTTIEEEQDNARRKYEREREAARLHYQAQMITEEEKQRAYQQRMRNLRKQEQQNKKSK